uniref:Uncharacterized protein n=1 Tax=Arundo donax TaxID=35708 RepID=A0A0A9HCU8_ARUDO
MSPFKIQGSGYVLFKTLDEFLVKTLYYWSISLVHCLICIVFSWAGSS